MRNPFLCAVHVGLPKQHGVEGTTNTRDRPWSSGIYKDAVAGALWLGFTNLVGDGQADPDHHGGPERAVLAYAAAHYPLWRSELEPLELPYGAFGENFTIAGLTEETVCIGDIYEIGGATVQVSQPRQPCWKLARRWQVKDLVIRVQANGRTGWYFRVLEEGYIEQGVPVILLDRPFPQWPIIHGHRVMHCKGEERIATAELAACPLLSRNWRKTLSARLNGEDVSDSHLRLLGPE